MDSSNYCQQMMITQQFQQKNGNCRHGSCST